MFSFVLFLHSITRWFVLAFLVFTLYRACIGSWKRKNFTATDDFVRHSTATLVHVQLIIGITLYTKSSLVGYFWNHPKVDVKAEVLFYPVIHFLLMLTAIILVTIGSALAKRKSTDREKFQTIVIWYSISLLIVLLAIPWPFSPLSQRPYLRQY